MSTKSAVKPRGVRYSFPNLEPQAILEILNELEINFTPENYENLTPQAVRAVWLGFLERLIGIREEDFLPSPSVLDSLRCAPPSLHARVANDPAEDESNGRVVLDVCGWASSFPQIFEEALGEMNFFHVLRLVMELAQMPNFALVDLTAPDKKRFQYFVSGLVNFLRFHTEQLAYMNQYVAEAVRCVLLGFRRGL